MLKNQLVEIEKRITMLNLDIKSYLARSMVIAPIAQYNCILNSYKEIQERKTERKQSPAEYNFKSLKES